MKIILDFQEEFYSRGILYIKHKHHFFRTLPINWAMVLGYLCESIDNIMGQFLSTNC